MPTSTGAKSLDQIFVVVGLLVMLSALLVLAVLFIDLVQKARPGSTWSS